MRKRFTAPGVLVTRPRRSTPTPPDPGSHAIQDQNSDPLRDQNNNPIEDQFA